MSYNLELESVRCSCCASPISPFLCQRNRSLTVLTSCLWMITLICLFKIFFLLPVSPLPLYIYNREHLSALHTHFRHTHTHPTAQLPSATLRPSNQIGDEPLMESTSRFFRPAVNIRHAPPKKLRFYLLEVQVFIFFSTKKPHLKSADFYKVSPAAKNGGGSAEQI